MKTVIIVTIAYTLVQIIYYIRKRYIKEIFIALFFISITVFYLVDFIKELNAPRISDILWFIFMPVVRLIFDI
mgnify:CR=1 FL=1